jgi:DNA repair protein RadC
MLPREKLLKYGASELTESELIAILLRTGTKGQNVIDVSETLFSAMDDSLYKLQQSSLEKIQKTNGLGEVKAITIKAALELGVRLYKELQSAVEIIKKPGDIFDICRDMTFLSQEVVRVISIDSKANVISVDDITKGTVNSSLIHPREVFKSAISNSAVSFALVHNHPSGDPKPSPADKEITKRLKECSKIVGIDIIDHVIIGKGRFYSFTLDKELQGGESDHGKQRSRTRTVAET